MASVPSTSTRIVSGDGHHAVGITVEGVRNQAVIQDSWRQIEVAMDSKSIKQYAPKPRKWKQWARDGMKKESWLHANSALGKRGADLGGSSDKKKQ
ncbi:hypothetical protein QYF36_012019 [Acer negundo]|nr:hypothetical protein QYF36_012019 [Acer negundo]